MSSHLVDVDSEIVGSSPSVGSTSVLAGLDAIGTTNAGSMPSLALCPAPFADGNTSVTVAATAPVGPVGLADPPAGLAMPLAEPGPIVAAGIVPLSPAPCRSPVIDTLYASSSPAGGDLPASPHAPASVTPSSNASSDAIAGSVDSADFPLIPDEPRSRRRLGATRVSSIGVQAHVVLLKRGTSITVFAPSRVLTTILVVVDG